MGEGDEPGLYVLRGGQTGGPAGEDEAGLAARLALDLYLAEIERTSPTPIAFITASLAAKRAANDGTGSARLPA